MFLFQQIIAALQIGNILFQLSIPFDKSRLLFSKNRIFCTGLCIQMDPVLHTGATIRYSRCIQSARFTAAEFGTRY